QGALTNMGQAPDQFGQSETQFGEDPGSAQVPFRQDRPIAEPARMGPAGRLIGTLMSPGETFKDINRKTTVVAPIIISILVGIAMTLFVNWQAKPDWRQIARNQIVKQSEKLGTKPDPERLDQQINVSVFIYRFLPV